MINKQITSDLLRGHTDTIVLGLLISGDKYGYEITKLIQDKTDKAYDLKEATMYSSFKRLESEGYITAYWGDETQGGRRKYYHITAKGKELYALNKSNWDFAKQILDKLINL